ncbi:MAG TPA: heme-binding protein [Blastocatellia bacterium]|nr:heme-binding protein [Blastocatellia bacterium]
MKSSFRIITFALALVALTTLAQAQITEKKSLTLDGARRVIDAAKAEAKRLNAPGGVIAVVDEGGNLMALERLDNTFAAGANISIGKARTAVLFKRPTKAFEDIIKNGRTAMVALPDSFFTPLQGGIPIIVDGQIVGGVGVSGAASAQQDEELAIAGANAFSTNPEHSITNGPVSYFEKQQVTEAFAKGAVLFRDSDKYMVHASRREKPGVAEVHTKDADIIYVLEGEATFVTGGTVVEPKTIAPDEIRGAEIKGGETRAIAKGDVIIVPAGTPHWFREVKGPVLYYVVKAR